MQCAIAFNSDMHPLTQIIWNQGLGCHQNADDIQLYLLMDGRQNSAPDDLVAEAGQVKAESCSRGHLVECKLLEMC